MGMVSLVIVIHCVVGHKESRGGGAGDASYPVCTYSSLLK